MHAEFAYRLPADCAFADILALERRLDRLRRGVYNLTGLPVYPNLRSAKMDNVVKTDAVGHWCARFSAETFDRLEVVEDWYRKALVSASETDLNHDERYRNLVNLVGIKLAVGIDSVTVYRSANHSTTSIELFRCSSPR